MQRRRARGFVCPSWNKIIARLTHGLTTERVGRADVHF